MISHFFKTAWRNFLKNKATSIINVIGLSVGIAVAILIGLWIWDEVSFNKNFTNYDRLAQVMQHQTFNSDVTTQSSLPYLIGEELRKDYGSDFKYVSMSAFTNNRLLQYGDRHIFKSGNYFEPQITEMLSLDMVKGARNALADYQSIILSESTAKALFGKEDPMGKRVKIDDKLDVKVTGIYKDLPKNSDYGNLTFIAPWKLYIDDNVWQEKATNPWRNNSFQAVVQLADHVDMARISEKIKDVKLRQVTPQDAAFKPVVFLLPMSRWHLFSEYRNGVYVGGRIEFVWLFGIIGFFVLLLACINFMNLSTARSEKRSKEVGIRKAVGSSRPQLIRQFLIESSLTAFLSFLLSLLLVSLILPSFNEVANKEMGILWGSPLFWIICLSFTLFTGILAGSYPALYLSSFRPVWVLKGVMRAGPAANIARKVLVVLQLGVSIVLIIGTIVVYNQIQYGKNRPVGYSREGLVYTYAVSEKVHTHFDVIRNELIKTGVVEAVCESSSAATYVDEEDNGFEWKGKDPKMSGDFGVVYSSMDFGKTIGWQMKEGRDFSREFATDSTGIILNETAVKFTGLLHPVGETIKWDGKAFHVIGVVKDMVMQSPYEPVFRTVFVTNSDPQPAINIRVSPNQNMHAALPKIEAVFKRLNPEQPFIFQFTDDVYGQKFGDEERVAKLSSFFAVLAIFISCLGLFGMASFMAEQRVKEIGIRKVLGASVLNLWQMLSKEFVWLVLISFLISGPLAYLFMHRWLLNYQYRTGISGWVFILTALGAIFITLATVSIHSIAAARANPVKSLKAE